MHTLNKIKKFISDTLNKRRQKEKANKFFGLYMESVGMRYTSDNGFGEGVLNKERYVKPRWNRNVKRLTDYEIMKRLS
jgi:hypothetical protein